LNSKIKALALGLIFSVIFSVLDFSGKCESISNKVLRLHIIANSNSKEDQYLKIKVRDRLIEQFGEDFKLLSDVNEAKDNVQKKIEQIKIAAQNEVYSQGYNYKVDAKTSKTYFPTRRYNQITLPAGVYEALRIIIGEAKGENWWCVMFPPMCLPAAQEKSEIEEILSPAETDIVENETNYVFKLKFLEIFMEVKKFFEDIIYKGFMDYFEAASESVESYEIKFKTSEMISNLSFFE